MNTRCAAYAVRSAVRTGSCRMDEKQVLTVCLSHPAAYQFEDNTSLRVGC